MCGIFPFRIATYYFGNSVNILMQMCPACMCSKLSLDKFDGIVVNQCLELKLLFSSFFLFLKRVK